MMRALLARELRLAWRSGAEILNPLWFFLIVITLFPFGVGAAPQLHDPQTNLDVSARYLKTLQQRFGNDLTLVLAAYNAGEGAVEKHGRRIPPYRETQDYVRKVMAEYGTLRRISLRQPARQLAGADLESLL